jgi:hypothetical protein
MAFLVLDSNHGDLGRRAWEIQVAWLRERLEAAERDPAIRCTALVAHHPVLSAFCGGGDSGLKKDVYDVAAGFRKFRLYFSGHHHLYQHIADGDRHCFVTGGGGAPLSIRMKSPLPKDARLVRQRRIHHLLRGQALEDRVRVEMHALGKNGWTVEEVVEVPYAEP